MSYIKENIYKIFTLALVLAYCLHASSCANTKGAPSGGPKDTIPPVVLKVNPVENATGFPVEKSEIEIVFNEYVQIKDANKNIILSPPQAKPVKSRIKGKSIIVTFQMPLNSAQTYSLNFGSGIVDNNESNPLNGFSYSFSTGDTVDSLMFSGKVVDAASLFPIENATVALYINPKDSSVMNNLPIAVAKTDKWGYFAIRNLKPVEYTIYAFSDENTNNKYDQGAEKIAFSDQTITPTSVMRKDSPQLRYYDPKDTAGLMQRPIETQMYLFAEKPTNQFIRDYKRFSRRGAYIKFNAPDVQIDSFSISGMKDEQIIRQMNILKDSITFWLNEPGKVRDTLILGIKYHKTDTSGNLTPAVENLRLVAPVEKKKDKNSTPDNDEKRKDLLEFEINSDAKMVEQNGVVLAFKEPLVLKEIDSIKFKMTNPKQIVTQENFSFEQDSVDINRYIIRPLEQFVKGNDYELYFPKGVFKDINGFTNDSTVKKISLPNNDNLSSITLELRNVNARYIIELINDKRTSVLRKYIINEDTDLLFPYLEKGNYSIRITEDKNSNGILDTGDLLQKKHPEKVLLYTLPGGKDIIELNERTDLVQSVNIAEMFGN